MNTISLRANDVRSRSRQGKPGQWAEMSSTDEYRTGLNKSPQAVSVYTVTVDTVTNSAIYTITVGEVGNQVVLTYTADGSATDAEIVAGLVAAINASSIARGQCTAAATSATVMTVTGLTPGIEVVVSDTDAKLTSALVTAAASSAAIPFGRMLIKQGYQSGEGEQLVALAKSALFTPQVITTPIAFVSAAVITVRVFEIRGNERIPIAQVDEASATSQDVTIDALVALLNTALPTNSVLAAADNGAATAIVFTAEVGGLEFDVEVVPGHEGASLPAVSVAYTTGPSESTSFHRAVAGLSCFSPIDPPASNSTTGTGEYAGNAGVIHAQRGKLYVESDETITASADVYVELGVDADNGQLFAADSATRIKVARSLIVWDRDGVTSADSVAIARISI